MHWYRAFGFTLASDIELPELWPADGGPDAGSDIEIRSGAVPQAHTAALQAGDYEVRNDGIVFAIPSVGRFWAQAGRQLIVEVCEGADPLAVRLFIKGSALAAIFHQRGLFPLHASAIECDGGCALFLGDSGAGKSTLAGMLLKRGRRILSDDVVVTRAQAGSGLLAEPSLPVLKLWPASLEVTGLSHLEAPYEALDHLKHRIGMPDSFVTSSRPIRRLYFLEWLPDGNPLAQVERLPPFAALLALRANIYREELIASLDREPAYVDFCQSLLDTADCFQLRRIRDLSRADEQIDILLRHLSNS